MKHEQRVRAVWGCNLAIAATVIRLALDTPLAGAGIVSFNFSGEVTSKTDTNGVFSGGFEAGSQFTGNATLNTDFAAVDAFPNDPGLAIYGLDSMTGVGQFALTMWSGGHVVIGRWSSVTVSDVPSGGSGTEVVQYTAGITSYDGVAFAPTFTAGIYAIGFGRTSPPYNAITGDGLPTRPPVFSDFDYASIWITASDPIRGIEFEVLGRVTAVSVVPEPATITMLLFLGCVGLLARRWVRAF